MGNWFDWVNILNPMHLKRNVQVLKFRILLTVDLYLILPIKKFQNRFASDEPTQPVKWDYNVKNAVDERIVEPSDKQLSKLVLDDFLFNKHGAYIRRSLKLMNDVMPSYIRGTVAKKLNETSIYNFIATTSLSFSCAPDGLTLDLSIFNRVPNDPERKHPILPAYWFKLDHENRKVQVFNDKDKPVDAGTPEVAVVLSTALLAYTHSFVHFHFPEAIAVFSDQLMHDPVKKFSKLAELLNRHTRFNLVFNYAGHNMFFPVQKQNWTFPYCFRITQNDFSFLNIARTQHYYYMTGKKQLGKVVTASSQYKDKWDFDDRFAFHRMTKMYYEYVDTYVRGFGVEANLLEELVAFLKVHVDSITIKDPMTMLVTLIWQVSVFHSLDHSGIYQQREHMAFGDPTDPWNVACSRYTLDTYVDPFASPGKNEYLSEYMDIAGLPGWDRLVSSISF
eukprot:scaffold15918_cov57-Attheya_sp.AAC.1